MRTRYLAALLFLFMIVATLVQGCGDSTTSNVAAQGPGSTDGTAGDPPFRGRGARFNLAEFASHPRALHPTVASLPTLANGARQTRDTTRPSSYTLPTTPPIANQGQAGACGGFSFGYALTTILTNLDTPASMSDPNFQISPAYVYHVGLLQPTTNTDYPNFHESFYTLDDDCHVSLTGSACSNGTQACAYTPFLVLYGGQPLADYPYDGITGLDCDTPAAICQDVSDVTLVSTPNPGMQVGQFQAIPVSDQDTTFELIEQYVSQGYPVVIGISEYSNFGLYGSGAQPCGGPGGNATGVFVGQGDPDGEGHWITIVGYDDDMGANGAILLQNSWADNWGSSGFVWFDKDSLFSSMFEAYVGMPASQQPPSTAPLTASVGSAPDAWVTGATQAVDGSSIHLILDLDVEEGVHLESMVITTPGATQITATVSRPIRTGYEYVSRSDGFSFPAGTYTVELNTKLTSGQSVTYTGTVTVAALPGTTATEPTSVTTSNGTAAGVQ